LAHISKRFGATQALADVGLKIAPGEVHALLGHNGSGKSTLIKILGGFHDPEHGAAMSINGHSISLPVSAGEFRRQGMAFVHQDLALIDSLTVTENLRIGAIAEPGLYVNWKRESRVARTLLDEFAVDVRPEQALSELEPWQYPLMAILRAVGEIRAVISENPRSKGLLVLDEPTATLSDSGKSKLFDVIKRITADGHAVLFVSHDVDEVLNMAHRVTVLRNGVVAGAALVADLNRDLLVEMILGEEVGTSVDAGGGAPTRDSIIGVVDELTTFALDGVSFRINAGEVLGIAGLLGSGFDQVCPGIFGAIPATGSLTLGNRRIDLAANGPAESMADGVAYVPGKRASEGCVQGLSAEENVTLPLLARGVVLGPIQPRRLIRSAAKLLRRFGVVPIRPRQAVKSFSGGNQQKLVVGKWMQLGAGLVLVNEPTQGVDVGARADIFALIRGAARDGAAIICASLDHEQLATLCDRVLVLNKGSVVSELRGGQITKDSISAASFRESVPGELYGR
jgi:ribose transport system ATP-binding protein